MQAFNASFLPNAEVVERIKNLKHNQALFKDEDVIAFYSEENQEVNFDDFTHIEYNDDVLQIKNTWDIFSLNKVGV